METVRKNSKASEEFYRHLEKACEIHSQSEIFILGDMNARLGNTLKTNKMEIINEDR